MAKTRFTSDHILQLIRKKTALAVLIVLPDDELSLRSYESEGLFEPLLESKGFSFHVLEFNNKLSPIEEFSCARFPQLRIFDKGKLLKKLVGIVDADLLLETLRSIE